MIKDKDRIPNKDFGVTQWEYRIEVIEQDEEIDFDTLGRWGWELVSVTNQYHFPWHIRRWFYFKRPLNVLKGKDFHEYIFKKDEEKMEREWKQMQIGKRK